MTFQMVTHCVVCEERLTPMDFRRFDTCDRCFKSGQDFAKDLGPEHEQETAGVEA
jgi:hypothetical protein